MKETTILIIAAMVVWGTFTLIVAGVTACESAGSNHIKIEWDGVTCLDLPTESD